jgi:hypothetical protein
VISEPTPEPASGRYKLANYLHRHFDVHAHFVLQWDFHPCGTGFIISSVYTNSLFLAVRDWKGLHLEGAAEVVTETLPTCWEVEVMNNSDGSGNAKDDEKRDVYVR